MIRSFLAGGALALFVLQSASAGADGFPYGYRPSERTYRPIGRVRPLRHTDAMSHHRRSFRRAYAVVPVYLPRHPSLPLYNDPPQRFPEP